MNLKTLLAMLGRKNVTLLAGVLVGLLLAVEFPPLLDEARQYVGTLGLGGVISIVVSLWLSTSKEKANQEKVLSALYSPPPVSPSDEKAALKVLQ